MSELLFVIVGVVSGLVVGLVFAKAGIAYRRLPYAIVILLAAVFYPILAAPGTPDAWHLLWWISLGIFAIPAVVGLFASPWWIAVGLILHAVFDAAVGLAGATHHVCPFYVPWCTGFDLALGIVFVFRVCITPESRVSSNR
jgi:hypothetical protein